ncbi:ELKS/Rab6-interacting/CAST family member 1 [Anabarilius grahami]|uniref:ELKS/Rab6-interacting/CAST family member 1 n=1 Tax=Anabarilius grahami TaxID=495550 RepID=A0A3N0Z211_ANAGA|nr:ELKS/Rab6-interacting/CAST family member 1 [Anabarilius grahami]
MELTAAALCQAAPSRRPIHQPPMRLINPPLMTQYTPPLSLTRSSPSRLHFSPGQRVRLQYPRSVVTAFSDINLTVLRYYAYLIPGQLESELEQCERESAELQEYANSVLQQIADHCPDILEQVVNALEESC